MGCRGSGRPVPAVRNWLDVPWFGVCLSFVLVLFLYGFVMVAFRRALSSSRERRSEVYVSSDPVESFKSLGVLLRALSGFRERQSARGESSDPVESFKSLGLVESSIYF